jgi:hypothetical protein
MNTQPDNVAPKDGAYSSLEAAAKNVDVLYDRTSDYNDAVIGMKAQLDHKLKKMDKNSAINELWESYVIDQAEEDSAMAQFCAVMLHGPSTKEYEDQLQSYDKRKKTGPYLSREEREYEFSLKVSRVEANHGLRDMIAQQPGAFKMKNLRSWYTTFTGNSAFAEGAIAGALSEIAVLEAADEREDFLNVHYGSVEDDLRGGDIMCTQVVQRNGRTEYIDVSIDVKAGKQMPEGKLKGDGIQLTIGVPTHFFDDYGHVGNDERSGIGNLIDLAAHQTNMRRVQKAS